MAQRRQAIRSPDKRSGFGQGSGGPRGMGSTYGSQQQTLDFNLHDSQEYFDQQIGNPFQQQRPPTG